jgi:hypothetical protein
MLKRRGSTPALATVPPTLAQVKKNLERKKPPAGRAEVDLLFSDAKGGAEFQGECGTAIGKKEKVIG